MKIPQKLQDKWKTLKAPGDANKMAEKIENGYAEMFNRALRTGECNENVFRVMADFYEERMNMVREYL